MAFVAEDGNGQEAATSYVSLDAFKAYAQDRGITLSSDDAALQGALVAATDWISANFAEVWKGFPSFAQQALDWPRAGIEANGTVQSLDYMPPQLIKATCALAIEALKGELWNNQTGNGQQVIEKTIDTITTKYNPVKPAEMVQQRNFDNVRAMLSPLCHGWFGQLRVTR